MTVTETDRDVLARTLWGEARREGLAGLVALAWSIRNRGDMDLHSDGTPELGGGGLRRCVHEALAIQWLEQGDPNYSFATVAR